MKRKLLSVAVSAIALAGVQSAQATTSYDVYLAGSSAQDNLVITEVYNSLCVAGTMSYYVDNANAANGATNTGNWGSNYKAYSCTLDSTKVTTVPGNPTVVFHKVNYGGSAQGVAPLFGNTAVPTLNINNGNCYQVSGYSAKIGNTSTSVPTYGCTTTNTNDLVAQYLDAGVSDVNPTMFQGVNKTYTSFTSDGNGSVSGSGAFPDVTTVPAGYTVKPGVSLLWAVPVSLNLYTALQAAQGLLNYGGSYGTGSCTAGQYSIDPTSAMDGACMPSLNRATLSSVISGALYDWSKLYFKGVSLTAAAADYDAHLPSGQTAISPSGASGIGSTVVYCQRTPGSGTAASQYAYFLNQPAYTAGAPAPINNFGNTFVFSVADSGNMEKCLDDFSTGSQNAQLPIGTIVNTGPDKAWAIGQQSSDKNATLGKHYRFIKLNGQVPNLAAAFAGDYAFINESTWQYSNSTAASRPTQAKIVTALITAVTNPANVYTDLNQYTVQQFGAGGFMGTVGGALANNPSYTVPTSVSLTYPVTPWTHTSPSGVLDNGLFPVINSHANIAP